MIVESTGYGAGRQTHAYYETFAAHWHAAHQQDSLWKQGLAAATEGMHPGDTVLDAGCGTGNIARTLYARGFRVTGLDYSESMLAIARREIPAVRFVRGSVLDPAAVLDGALYDAVVTYGVLDHLPPPECERALLKLGERLKPGGRLFLGVRMKTTFPSPRQSVAPPFVPGVPETRFFYKYSILEMTTMLASAQCFATRKCTVVKDRLWYVEALATVARE